MRPLYTDNVGTDVQKIYQLLPMPSFRIFSLILYLSIFSQILLAQKDSTILFPEQLKGEDIFPKKETIADPNLISLFGKTEALNSLPYNAYVITKEEIRENGYLTLTDALRMVPGIFVSPLGSAREGELFMMHGMRGNRMAEIMINGISIKPMLASGMPIGATLPIRQAERIEIIYGPGSAQYGIGMNAGIINIVLNDSDRPVYTQADLSLGGRGYNNIDLMFGGKLGKGKRILKFAGWGSSTNFDDWNIGYPDSEEEEVTPVFIPYLYDTYYEDGRYEFQSNYRGTSNLAERSNFPHQSRHFGLQFQYNKLEFMVDVNYRRDHAALGLNPLTVSYANPVSYTASSTTRLQFRKKMGEGRFRFGLNVSGLAHNLDPASSAQPIQSHYGYGYEQNAINRLELAGVSITPQVIDSIYELNQARNFSGDRFRAATDFQFNILSAFSLKISRQYQMNFGVGLESVFGGSEVSHLSEPFNNSGDSTIFSIPPLPQNDFFYGGSNDAAGKGYAYLSNDLDFGPLKLRMGLNFSAVINELDLLPRIALNYQWKPNLFLRSNYWEDHWYPNWFFVDHTFLFGRDISRSYERYTYILDLYPPTKTQSFDLGLRWHFLKQNDLDIQFFVKKNSDVLKFETRSDFDLKRDGVFYASGYFSDAQVFQQILGIQGQLQMKNVFGLRKLDSRLGFIFSKSFEQFPEENNRRKKGLPEYPSFIGQWRLSYHPGNWYLSVENILQKSARSIPIPVSQTIGGLITDLMIRYRLSRNFDIYIKGSNILNTHYSGISADDSLDALLYNVQPLARFRLGASYRLD